MRNLILLILVGILVGACQAKNNQAKEGEGVEAAEEEIAAPKPFPALEGGDVFYKNKDPFGGIVELKGKHLEAADTVIFKLKEPYAVIRDGKLIVKSLGGEGPALLFNYPELSFIRYQGKFGNGPDEFLYPEMVSTNDPNLLCYLFELSNEKLYQMDRSGALTRYVFPWKKTEGSRYSQKGDIKNIGPDDFLYVDNSKTGKSIFRAYLENDSVHIREVTSLNLNPKRKGWANYIGDFGINAAKNRMVYAYKYFKILKFMDMDAQTIKTINFEKEEFDESTLALADGMDNNVTHYWGMSAQEDYVYCLYSGRTPMVASRENMKGQHYIYVEQYDWNGTPIRTFKLDQWGYFFVDEEAGKLFLMCYYEDDPFFEFQLPPN